MPNADAMMILPEPVTNASSPPRAKTLEPFPGMI